MAEAWNKPAIAWYVTRLAVEQALARKMAHEVKNSLTPIRLTMGSRAAGAGPTFWTSGAIVVDEVQTLERRVRAFPNCGGASVSPAEIT